MLVGISSLKLTLVIAITFISTLAVANPSDIKLTSEQIQAENEMLLKLGLDLRGQKFLSERPYSVDPLALRPQVMPAKFYTNRPREVNADALAKDLEILEHNLRMQYSGWEVAEARGWSWKNWFNKWRSQLNAQKGKTLPVDEAFAPIAELKAFQPDNHTTPLVPFKDRFRFFGRGTTALLTRAPKGPVTQLISDKGETFAVNSKDVATQPREVLVGAESGDFDRMEKRFAIIYPRNRGHIAAVVAGGEKISLVADYDDKAELRLKAALELAQLKEDAPVYRRLTSEIGYVRMPTMSAQFAQGYADLARDIFKLSDGKEKVVILDVRHNGGGAFYGNHLARWYKPDELGGLFSRLIFRSTVKVSYLTPSIGWGGQMDAGIFENPSPENLKAMQSLIDDLMEPVVAEEPVLEVYEGDATAGIWKDGFDLSQDVSRPILLVVTDDRCGSNCESVVGIASALPNAIIAGVSTVGVGEFGSVGTFLLPHSGVPFQVSTNHLEIFRDGRSFESYGLPPHILLNTAKSNSSAYILELAESLARRRK